MPISIVCINDNCKFCAVENCGHHCHHPAEPSLFDDPERPYVQDGQPSAGWSGTDTSKAAEPIRALSQQQVFNYLQMRGHEGATVPWCGHTGECGSGHLTRHGWRGMARRG